jgi:hypothetical protein
VSDKQEPVDHLENHVTVSVMAVLHPEELNKFLNESDLKTGLCSRFLL